MIVGDAMFLVKMEEVDDLTIDSAGQQRRLRLRAIVSAGGFVMLAEYDADWHQSPKATPTAWKTGFPLDR
ncbi:hypothetical protein QD461_28175 [Rhizobium sp. BR 314]